MISKAAEAPSVPKPMQPRYGEIVALTDKFCEERLNAEYAELSRKMTAALARKRPSPLATGQARTWACAIIYALGQINNLADRSSEPAMSMSDLCAGFAVGASTAGNKAAEIRKMLKVDRFSPEYSLRARVDRNPLFRLLAGNRVIMTIQRPPTDAQDTDLGPTGDVPDEKV